MRVFRVVAAGVGALFVCASALAQSGIGVEVTEVEDNRAKAGPFSGNLTVKVNLTGSDLDKIDSARVVVAKATDDKGNDLWEGREQENFQGREYNMGELRLSMTNPARSSKTISLSGTVEILVPSKDPNSVVKIDKYSTKIDKPLAAKALKSEKLSITLLSPKKYAEARESEKLDDAKIEEIRERGRKEGVSEEEIENVIGMMMAIQEMGGGTPPEGAVILNGKEADMDRIVRIRLLYANGEEFSVPSRSSSTSDGMTTTVLEPADLPPADAVLELTIVTKKATTSIPFALNGIELP